MTHAADWLQFRLSDQTHALEAACVRHIARAPQLLPLPLPSGVMRQRCPGLMAWQGRALPVLDLGACLLRRPSARGEQARFVVWTQARQAGVFAVDGVGAVLRLSPATLTEHWAPVQPGLPKPWSAIHGVLHGGVLSPPAASVSGVIAVFDALALWQACWSLVHHGAGGHTP